MRVFRGVRNGLQRMLAAERFAQMGLFEHRRAHERSLTLLVQCLTPAQRAEFAASRAFIVRGESGQRYRITYGDIANVEVLTRSGMVLRQLCAGPVDVPTPAVMLAQKLMLETQESEFLRIARGSERNAIALRPTPELPHRFGRLFRTRR
jgi:hypothetical protein